MINHGLVGTTMVSHGCTRQTKVGSHHGMAANFGDSRLGGPHAGDITSLWAQPPGNCGPGDVLKGSFEE